MSANLIDYVYASLEFLIALGVLGEVIRDLVPRTWFPEWVREEYVERVAWWSTLILVISLFIIIPVSLERDASLSQAVSRIAANFHPLNEDEKQKVGRALATIPKGTYSFLVRESHRDPRSNQAILRDQLVLLFDKAGWTPSADPLMGRIWDTSYDKGIKIGYLGGNSQGTNDAKLIKDVLESVGMEAQTIPYSDISPNCLFIEIGYP